jgi:hypothetical protein
MSVSHSLHEGEVSPQIPSSPTWMAVHFLGWLAATLILLLTWEAGLLEAVSSAASEKWQAYELTAVLALTLLEAGVFGLSLWMLAIGVTQAIRGKPFFQHPGHWLLAVIGLTAMGQGLVAAADYYGGAFLQSYRLAASPSYAIGVAVLLMKPVLFWLAFRIGIGGFRWQLVFIALTIWTACDAVTFALTTTAPIWRFQRWTALLSSTLSQVTAEPLVVLLPFLVVAVPFAAYGDYRKVARDWPHWVGAAAAVWLVTWRLVAMQMA